MASKPLLHDIFCQIVDNFGDIGVCWRLAVQLAERGHWVRLWVNGAEALAWMAPLGHARVTVLPWSDSENTEKLHKLERSDVWIEAFGCEISPNFIANYAHGYWTNGQNSQENSHFDERRAPKQPVWLNLEYLTAEKQAERNHALPSPVMHGPAKGWVKHFFYPGFTSKTGGLLREAQLADNQAAFNRSAWLRKMGIDWQGERLVSMFCYEPAALCQLLAQLSEGDESQHQTRLLVTHGRATAAVQQVLAAALQGALAARDTENALLSAQNLAFSQKSDDLGRLSNIRGHSLLFISYLPKLSQIDFDHLLWACDLNFVRGEDSLVRAVWAQKPFVWQLYPQSDGAEQTKLDAFLDRANAPPSWRMFHAQWNAREPVVQALPLLSTQVLTEWATSAGQLHKELQGMGDLVTQLLAFVDRQREPG